MTRVQVRHFIAVDTACPDVYKALPDALSDSWPIIDTPREVVVEFKLDGERARDVKIVGGHGDNVEPLRRAVQALQCHSPGDGTFAVRFRIKFEEPRV